MTLAVGLVVIGLLLLPLALLVVDHLRWKLDRWHAHRREWWRA